MIISERKLGDLRFREIILKDMAYFIATGRIELAKLAGEVSNNLKKRYEN